MFISELSGVIDQMEIPWLCCHFFSEELFVRVFFDHECSLHPVGP